jgi:hypothetical protein
MKKLFPKMYCINTPFSLSELTVWLRSLLIWFASCEFIEVKLPTAVIIKATIKTAIVDRILLRLGEAFLQKEKAKFN